MHRNDYIAEIDALNNYKAGPFARFFYPRRLLDALRAYTQAKQNNEPLAQHTYTICHVFTTQVGFFRTLFLRLFTNVFSQFSQSNVLNYYNNREDFLPAENKIPKIIKKIQIGLIFNYDYSNTEANQWIKTDFFKKLNHLDYYPLEALLNDKSKDANTRESVKYVIDEILNGTLFKLNNIDAQGDLTFAPLLKLSTRLKQANLLKTVMETYDPMSRAQFIYFHIYLTLLNKFEYAMIAPPNVYAYFEVDNLYKAELIIKLLLELKMSPIAFTPFELQTMHDAILKISSLELDPRAFGAQESDSLSELFFTDAKTGLKIATYINTLDPETLAEKYQFLTMQSQLSNPSEVIHALKVGMQEKKLRTVDQHAPQLRNLEPEKKLQLMSLSKKLELDVSALLTFASTQKASIDLLLQVLGDTARLKTALPELFLEFKDFISIELEQSNLNSQNRWRASSSAPRPSRLLPTLEIFLPFSLENMDNGSVTEMIHLLLRKLPNRNSSAQTSLLADTTYEQIQENGQKALHLLLQTFSRSRQLNNALVRGLSSDEIASRYRNYLLKLFLEIAAQPCETLLQDEETMLYLLAEDARSHDSDYPIFIAANQFFEEEERIDNTERQNILQRLYQPLRYKRDIFNLLKILYKNADRIGLPYPFPQETLDQIFDAQSPGDARIGIESVLRSGQNLDILKNYLPQLLKTERNLQSMVPAIQELQAQGRNVEDYMQEMQDAQKDRSKTTALSVVRGLLSIENCGSQQENILKNKLRRIRSAEGQNDFVKALQLLHAADLIDDAQTSAVLLRADGFFWDDEDLRNSDVYFQTAQFLVALKSIDLDHEVVFNTIIENAGNLYHFDAFYETCTKLAHHGLLHSKASATEAMQFVLNFAPLFGFINSHVTPIGPLYYQDTNTKKLDLITARLLLLEPFNLQVIRDIHRSVFNDAQSLHLAGDSIVGVMKRVNQYLNRTEKESGGPGHSNTLHNYASRARVIRPTHPMRDPLSLSFFEAPASGSASSSHAAPHATSQQITQGIKDSFAHQVLEAGYEKTQRKMANQYQELQYLEQPLEHHNCNYNYI